MRLFITGICGFAGSALARHLRELLPGATISGIDSLSRTGSEINRRTLTAEGITVRHGDVRCASDFESLPDTDWVIDAAAQPGVLSGLDGKSTPRQLIEHNLLGTLNMLEYCRRSRAGFILLSTSRVYSIRHLCALPLTETGDRFVPAPDAINTAGLSAAGVNELFPTSAPVSLYGSTKLASETLALEYGETFGLPVWINRCGVLAGAGQFGTAEQGIFSFWIHAWQQRRPLRFTGFAGSGYQVRDALHPADLASLVAAQITYPTANSPSPTTPVPRIFNAGGGPANSHSLAELSKWCRHRLGPHPVAPDPSPRQWDIPWMVMDSSRAATVFGWRPLRPIAAILEEIALHAGSHPGWLDLSGA